MYIYTYTYMYIYTHNFMISHSISTKVQLVTVNLLLWSLVILVINKKSRWL